MIILDFDGTLFNTLPVHFKIKKQAVYKHSEIFFLHREFIERRRVDLESYVEVWRHFIKIFSRHHNLYLISETSKEILSYYLKVFKLFSYFSQIFGSELAKDGSRERRIKQLLHSEQKAWLISDNLSDQKLKMDSLEILNAQHLYTASFASFCTQVFNFKRTIFVN